MALIMNNDEQLLMKRFRELAIRAQRTQQVVYSSFLSLYEQQLLRQTLAEAGSAKVCLCENQLELKGYDGARVVLDGGYAQAERRLAVFLPAPDSWIPSEVPYPEILSYISCDEALSYCVIEIRAAHAAFAQNLTHRDYLGALMKLGLERETLGDIIVLHSELPDGKSVISLPETSRHASGADKEGPGRALVFVRRSLASIVLDELQMVNHTKVACRQLEGGQIEYEPEYKEIIGTVASIRLDALLSLGFHESRTKLAGLISGGKVFLNGKQVLSNSQEVSEGDLVSVRQMGKFRFEKIMNESRKGRIFVCIHRFI